jgi:hypothetical protein
VVVSWVLLPRAAMPGMPPPPSQAAATMATAPTAKVAGRLEADVPCHARLGRLPGR